MKVIWKKWEPQKGLQNKYYIDEVTDDIEKGLSIVLSDEEGKQLILNWDGVVESYMCTEESARTILYDNPELTMWTFFKIENSQYLQWIVEQSIGICQNDKIHHFCIIGINSIVDIVAGYEPVVYWEDER